MSLISIFFIHLLALASPGPDFVFVSQVAANHTKKEASLAVLGIVMAIGIWVIIAISGLSVIIEHSPITYGILLALGGSYLIWLGVTAIKTCFKNVMLNNIITPNIAWKNNRFFIKGLLTNLANPKALAYFGSIFAVAIAHSSIHKLIIMFIMIIIESLLWFYLVATIFSSTLIANWYRNQLKTINFICGLAFISFGIGLIYSLIVRVSSSSSLI